MSQKDPIFLALQAFANAVTSKMTQVTLGEPEDQIRGPFENLMTEIAGALKLSVVCTGETPLPDRLGRPDYAIHCNSTLTGYVELKAPGVGADTRRFKGHNLDQWKRFQAIPNLLYCDGNEWALYRSGQLIGKIARLSGDVSRDAEKAVDSDDVPCVEALLRDFFSWEPIIPTSKNGKIELKSFASILAPLCRMLRDGVIDALKDPNSPLVQLAKDWRQLLFPDATDERFADAYAQTVAFALLLGRSEGADPLTLDNAEKSLVMQHNLLSRALQVLTDPMAQVEISAPINLLLRIIACVPTDALTGPEDPWLYFYEDFLAAYDPKLRKDVGAYYTPIEVVHAQVRLIDDLLTNRLGKRLGFVDSGVITLDPATGTGTYLLGIIEHALAKIEKEQGVGAVPGQASTLATNLYGFELMVGPYAVTELRTSRALHDRGALLPKDGTHVYLTDTLESPHVEPPVLPLYLKPISDQHVKALDVKRSVPVIVCIGNPPYDRHEAARADNKARTGGWVRWGDDGIGSKSILRDFIEPAIAAGHGGDIKNLYNLYVYFWRWALWKVFEDKASSGPGVVSFISGSSYLEGDAFCGMREHMRRLCDEIWILDLGGEGRGTRKDENIFAIQTPVAIAIAVRYGEKTKDKPATVHYIEIDGTRRVKLTQLDSITSFSSIDWHDCSSDWKAPFRPAGIGSYFDWPLLTDLMPWQHSGVQLKRTWPVAPSEETLQRRWQGLLNASSRSEAFHGSGDREIDGTYRITLNGSGDSRPITQLPSNADMESVAKYAYRSFDLQYIIADGRLISRPRPDLWSTQGPKQVYIASLLSHPLGGGPALTACFSIPDLHYFRGSYGGKDVLPLYRNAGATDVNILPGLLGLLDQVYKYEVEPEDFLAYVYGMLALPAYTVSFSEELKTCELRVPITKDSALFAKVRDFGAKLLWLHTYGERFVPENEQQGIIPPGAAKCTKAVPGGPDGYPVSFEYNDTTQTLHVGDGEFYPVSPEVFEFDVSGLKVVQSWLKYRMKDGAGRKSSPLDDIRPECWTSQFTSELLRLLWILEETVAGYPEQTKLMEAVISGQCFKADELPSVPASARKLSAPDGSLFGD